uniref:Cullin 9 n=1 Tax=Ornithorhynchus anatinus TaxID=9258 RepID=A0A6I8NV51_ORNAN
MVGERRGGDLLVPLGPRLQARPEEMLRQRPGPDGHPEYLIRWSVLRPGEEGAAGGRGPSDDPVEHILMWLSALEVRASCPSLLGERAADKETRREPVGAPGVFSRDVGPDEASLREMGEDVRELVRRAARQLGRSEASPAASLLHTVHVLSAYASIGPLAGVFRDTGALDLLMTMLGGPEPQIRRSAGKMLRALAAHDAGSRAHVLLSLSQQDGIEQHMDFDSRSTLLELFAETKSFEEHCMAFEGISLPQIPGKQLFSLVKRYLCVTSLLDQLSGSLEFAGEDRASPCKAAGGKQSRTERELEFGLALGSLILELVRGMGWDRGPGLRGARPPARPARSIFLAPGPALPLPPPWPCRRQGQAFRSPSDFSSRSGYAEYVQETLQPGMRVRMVEDYEEIGAGDEGEFQQSNTGMPPVQVLWESTGRTYWVHWHMLEILGPGDTGKDKVPAFAEQSLAAGASRALNIGSSPWHWKPPGSLYSVPYLQPSAPGSAESRVLSRAEWWEILFFIKKLAGPEQESLLQPVREGPSKEAPEEKALAELSVPVALAQRLVLRLSRQCQGGTRSDLLCSHIYSKYGPRAHPKEGEPPGPAPADPLVDVAAPEAPPPATPQLPEVTALPPGEAQANTLEPPPGPPGEVPKSLQSPAPDSGPSQDRLQEPGLSEGNVSPDDWDVEALLQQLQQQPEHFLLLARSLEMLGPRKATQLRGLRMLTKLLEGSGAEALPWHEAAGSCLTCMNASGADSEVVQEAVRFLHRLASSNKDCAVVLCRLGAREALTKALAQSSSQLLLGPELRKLLDHCQKQASLYGNLTTSILAGCIQLVLGQIEEHRRTQQPINIPFLDVFLRHLCQGSSEEVREDRCWEKVEVSSNTHRASKLTDRNPKTYWESNGSTGSHHITLHVRRGVLIRQLTMLVSSEDSSYMPARVVVLGGDSISSVNTELNSVNITSSASRVLLLENLTCFWPIIQIRIKRCQQGGIDTRVRGLEVLGPKPTLWPLFREQLCRRSRLFYAVRAQAWSRDIAQDRTRLLRLFPRLNRALGHEQAFADRFLPDEEAGLALGRTCWEALITPLVHSITSPDASGLSPLAWLLDQYLEHRAGTRPPENHSATFTLQVRRLSHLLVHMESSSTLPSELSSGSASAVSSKVRQNPEPGPQPGVQEGSLRAITQCWSGVVQAQVKQFLAAAGQAPDFVPRYCELYRRLQTAGAELFGACQAGFVPALRRGFSAALQQLPFLTASHVCEQFARYIDRQILASRAGGAAGMESLEQLQQSLESFLVLSGLELATSFEHFYRYYLGERLLGPGPCWLEEAVLDQIGLCFPNRLPQQMLSGLRAAAELQRHFRLFRLQLFDRRLLERGQEEGDEADGDDDGEERGPEAGSPGKVRGPGMAGWHSREELKWGGWRSKRGAGGEAGGTAYRKRLSLTGRPKPLRSLCLQPAEEEEEEDLPPEVSVLALPSHCWPVSPFCFLQDPSKRFPPALSGCLGCFSEFYSHSQSRPGPESGPRRRLQWTWLGWAELVFGAQQRLLVSTLQMWILLHFNEAQEVTVENLLQSSGLALELLTQALGPLTSSPGPLTLHEAQGLPPGGVLRLREEAAEGVRPRGPPLRLLPPRTYLNVEEGEGRALEKKRNLLNCLLVRILKARGEDGLHIDCLVCMVRRGEAEKGTVAGGRPLTSSSARGLREEPEPQQGKRDGPGGGVERRKGTAGTADDGNAVSFCPGGAGGLEEGERGQAGPGLRQRGRPLLHPPPPGRGLREAAGGAAPDPGLRRPRARRATFPTHPHPNRPGPGPSPRLPHRGDPNGGSRAPPRCPHRYSNLLHLPIVRGEGGDRQVGVFY